MVWLTILDNEILLVVAQVLLLVVGSMLLGILLSYLYWGGARTKAQDLALRLGEEQKHSESLHAQLHQMGVAHELLQIEIRELQSKSERLAKTIYDHQQYIFNLEADHKKQKATIDDLHAAEESFQQKLRVIKEEVIKAQAKIAPVKKSAPLPVRANYDHVSQLLGRQVAENDLTLILGVGPKTAALLQAKGIQTWDDLAGCPEDTLRSWLDAAGGIYRSQDASQWPKQALMASQGEWRKLRVFQEALRRKE